MSDARRVSAEARARREAGADPRGRRRALRPVRLRGDEVGRRREPPSGSARPRSTTTSSRSSTASSRSWPRRSRSSASSSTRTVGAHDDWSEALVAVLRGGFELTEWEVLRHARADGGARPRRPCTARCRARRRPARAPTRRSATSSSPGARSSPAAWSRGSCPSATRSCSTRAVIGLYNSVWVWYRPGGAPRARRRRQVLRRPAARAARLRARHRGAMARGGLTLVSPYPEIGRLVRW